MTIGPPKKTLSPDLRLTRKEIADLFSISVETVKRRTSDGLLKPDMVNSRVIHYTAKDVRAMVQQGYRLNLKKALTSGMRPEDVGYHTFQTQATSVGNEGQLLPPLPPTADGHAPRSPVATPAPDFAAEVFRAKLRWALAQADVRSMILQLVHENSGMTGNS